MTHRCIALIGMQLSQGMHPTDVQLVRNPLHVRYSSDESHGIMRFVSSFLAQMGEWKSETLQVYCVNW